MEKINVPLRKLGKRGLSILLSLALLASVLAMTGIIQASAQLIVDPGGTPPAITFYAPETIYIDPTWTTTEFYVNNFTNGSATGASFGSARAVNNETAGYIHFYSQFATNVFITVDDAPAWYYAKGATIASGTAVNLNATLGAGGLGQRSATAGNATEGLVRWKVTFFDTSRQANFESYCYSYLYRPDRRAVTGAIINGGLRNTSSDPGTLELRACSGIYIKGSHLQAGHAYGGNLYASNNLINHMWGTAMTGTATYAAYAPGTQAQAGDPMGVSGVDAGIQESQASDSNWHLIQDTSRSGGKGYIQVDSSRYTNLNQIPNLEYKYIVNRLDFNTTRTAYTVRGYNATASVRYGNSGFWYTNWSTHTGGSYIQNPTGAASVSMTNPGTTGFNTLNTANSYYYVTRQGTLSRAVVAAQGNLDTYSITGGYLWWMTDNESTGNVGHLGEEHVCQHRVTTQLDVWSRNKGNLRDELQAQIQSGLQYKGMQGDAAYRAALESLATALCKPNFQFSNPAADMDLPTLATSLGGQVRIAAANLKPKNGQAEVIYRNAVTGGIIPMYVPGNNLTYEMGESVRALYDQALDVPDGYIQKPIAVSAPYVPAGQDAAVTNITAPGLNPLFTNADNALTGLFWTNSAGNFPATGNNQAPNSSTAPNTNCRQARVNWVFWLRPKLYNLVLQPGDGSGGDITIKVYYGDEIIMPGTLGATNVAVPLPAPPNSGNAIVAPAGATLVGWKFDNGPLAGGMYAPGAGNIKNLTTTEGGTIYATAQWIGGVGSTFTFNFGNALGTRIITRGNALPAAPGPGGDDTGPVVSGMIHFSAPAGSQIIDLGTWPTGSRPGYSHDGWFFDFGSWQQPLASFSGINVSSTSRTVFAKWTPYFYRINYGANTGVGTPPPSHTNVAWDSTVNALPPDDLSKPGFIFRGWSVGTPIATTTNPLAGLTAGVDYFTPGAPMTNLISPPPTTNTDSITLYAIWEALPPVTFTFNFGAGTVATPGGPPAGTIVGNQVNFSVPAGSKISALPAYPTGAYPGFAFDGWYFDNGSWLQSLASLAASEVENTTCIVYAKWVPYTFNIMYNGNFNTGGTPPGSHMTVNYGLPGVGLSGPNDLVKMGYTFEGWSTSPIAAGPGPLVGLTAGTDYFLQGTTVTFDNLQTPAPMANGTNITLYAIWQARTPEVIFDVNWHDWTTAEVPVPTGLYFKLDRACFGENYDTQINPVSRATTTGNFPVPGTTGVYPDEPMRFGWTFGNWEVNPANPNQPPNPPGSGTPVTAGTNLNQLFQASDHKVFAYWYSGTPIWVILDPGATDATLAAGTPTPGPGDQTKFQRGQGSVLPLTVLAGYQPTRPGYTFDGWEIDNPADALYSPSLSATMQPGDDGILLNNDGALLIAKWKETVYRIHYNYNYLGDDPNDPNIPDPTPDPVTAYLAGGLLKIASPPPNDYETPQQLTRPGYKLLGFALSPNGALAFGTGANAAVLATILAGPPGNTAENNAANPEVILNVYAVWEVKSGPGDDTGDDDDDEDDDSDGVILLRYVVPAGITLVPAAPTFKYLTFDQPYGTLATATKPGDSKNSYSFVGWKVIQLGSGTQAPYDPDLEGLMISSSTVCKHVYSIYVEPVFKENKNPTCWQKFQNCMRSCRNWIIKLFWPALAIGLPILNYGIPHLTVSKVFDLPCHTLFLASLIGCILMPIVLIVPSWFTVINELAPSWWPNVKRIYLLP